MGNILTKRPSCRIVDCLNGIIVNVRYHNIIPLDTIKLYLIENLSLYKTTIKNLPLLPKLKKLKCKKCENIQLPYSDIIEDIDIISCNIVKLHEWPNLKYLSITDCPVTNVYEWPKIEYIKLVDCPYLKELFDWKSIKYVELSNISASVQSWQNLRELQLYDSDIIELPLWPRITDAVIDNCKYLNEIPCWDQLFSITINGCKNIKSLPCWPYVSRVEYTNGAKKVNIPSWPLKPHLNDFLIKNQPVLRRYTITQPLTVYSEKDCIICYDNIANVTFKCGHRCCCRKCSDKIFKSQKHECPICRKMCFPMCKKI